jgi:hypothetical protein
VNQVLSIVPGEPAAVAEDPEHRWTKSALSHPAGAGISENTLSESGSNRTHDRISRGWRVLGGCACGIASVGDRGNLLAAW